jgi:hypothetical protein
MVAATMNELRRALSEMNDGVRALLGPERGVPELVGELLEDWDARRVRPRSRAAGRTPRRHLALVK